MGQGALSTLSQRELSWREVGEEQLEALAAQPVCPALTALAQLTPRQALC